MQPIMMMSAEGHKVGFVIELVPDASGSMVQVLALGGAEWELANGIRPQERIALVSVNFKSSLPLLAYPLQGAARFLLLLPIKPLF